jgi:hypothetical protein
MTRIEGFNDPEPLEALGTSPHRTKDPHVRAASAKKQAVQYARGKSVMEGSRAFLNPVFLRLCPPTMDHPQCQRMPDKKQCARCGRGTHLQFAFGEFLKLRLCRRSLTANEKAALFAMLTEAEAGGLTD